MPTVRLLSNYTLSGVNYSANDLVSVDSFAETQLVNGKIADNNAAAIARAIAEGETVRVPSDDAARLNAKQWRGDGRLFDSMASFQAAGGAAANPGPVWIGGVLYFGDSNMAESIYANNLSSVANGDIPPQFDISLDSLAASVTRSGAPMTVGGSRATNRADGTDLSWDAGLNLADGNFISVRYVFPTPVNLVALDRLMLEFTHDNNWINTRLQFIVSSVADSSTGASSRAIFQGNKHLSEMAWMNLKSDFSTFSGSGVNWADVRSIEFRFTKHTATNANQRALIGLKRLTIGQYTKPKVLFTCDDNAIQLYQMYQRNSDLNISADIFCTDYEIPGEPAWTSTKCTIAQNREMQAAGFRFYPHNMHHRAYSFGVSSYSRTGDTVTIGFNTGDNQYDILPRANDVVTLEEFSAEQLNGEFVVNSITGSGTGPYSMVITVIGASFDNAGVSDGGTITVNRYDLKYDIQRVRQMLKRALLWSSDKFVAATYGYISRKNMNDLSSIGVNICRSTSGQNTQQEPLTTAMVFQVARKYGMGGQSARLLAIPTHLLTTAEALQTLLNRLLLVGGVLSVYTHGDDISNANLDACLALLAQYRDAGQIDIIQMHDLEGIVSENKI